MDAQWRWVLLNPQREMVAYGQRGPWPLVVGDLHAVADEIMAERAAVILRDGGDLAEMAGHECRVWRGGVRFNGDGEPVDEAGVVVPYGQSWGDGWVKDARAA